ncbi:MAG: 16S rRNA (guanine(966)-N(2))-methyltransferase RsmD [Halieaceae bacterium]|nr:16S rRNA (guanine(966)-N(2))-methyltransferase RsmD [Halieaceae bacterium]
MTGKSGRRGSGRGSGQLRIIGGAWRGRKLPIADVEGLRPTADRLRETLFNWLVAQVPDARCLDLFAGTGALGLEALSRGAAHCDFVEPQRQALEGLRASLTRLGAGDRARAHGMKSDEAVSILAAQGERYDLVFLDPPFGAGLLEPTLTALVDQGALAADALVYAEFPRSESPGVPAALKPWKEGSGGRVSMRVYRYR